MKNAILILLFFNITINAQVHQEWVSIYDGPRHVYDEATCIAIDNFGNVIIAGTSGLNSSWTITTVKYDNQGFQQWVKTYGYGQVATAHDIEVDKFGNIYVTGGSMGSGSGFDMVTIKYDSSSNQLWVKSYNGNANGDDESYKLCIDDFGNVYVAGYSLKSSNNYELVLVKYNYLGSQQWVKHYDTQTYNNGTPLGLSLYNNKYIYIASRLMTNDGTLIKFDSAGALIWSKAFNGRVVDLVLDDSENLYLTGSIRLGVGFHFLVMKFNSLGDSLWESIYDGPPGNDFANAIVVDSARNVFVTGRSYGGSSSLYDYMTVKYDSLGFEKWNRRYNGAGGDFDEAKSIASDKYGNIYITGYTKSGISYHNNCTTIKYDNNGTQVWEKRFNDADLCDGNQLILDTMGNVYVCGKTDFGGVGYNMLTIKYSQIIGVRNLGNQIPSSSSLSQNYPNPFNPVTRIKYDVPKASLVKIIIYDILGREIETLVNQSASGGQKPGSYEVTWDGSRYGSGVYFYKLVTDDFVKTKKMVLIK